MKESVKMLRLNRYEIGIIIKSLNELRNQLLRAREDTEVVDRLLLKTIDAPEKETFVKRLMHNGRCR